MRKRTKRCGRVCHTTPQGVNTFSYENRIYLNIQKNEDLSEREKRWVAHLMYLLREAEEASCTFEVESVITIKVFGKTFKISQKEYIKRHLKDLGF